MTTENNKCSGNDYEEIRLLYQNATANIESLKNRQWHVFVFYSAIAAFLIVQVKDMEIIEKAYISVVLFFGTIVAICALKEYQRKMDVEREVLCNIYENFGTLFEKCRKPKGDVKASDDFEKLFIQLGGCAYLVVTLILVLITFWGKHIC